ncbi:hypothetical protein GCK32_000973, partial [Trichostrongylus colubriformis]
HFSIAYNSGLPRLSSHWSNYPSCLVQIRTAANHSKAHRVTTIILLFSYFYLCCGWRHVYGGRHYRLNFLHDLGACAEASSWQTVLIDA